jgi:hypothetical protein
MASFPELRLDLPLDSTEGFRMVRVVLAVAAALLRAAVAAFNTVSELATPRGTKATPAALTRALGALHCAGALVRTPALRYLNYYSRVER